MTVDDPIWDEESRAWALALEHYELTLCSCGCGFPAVVSQAPENEDCFEVDLPIRCHARTALVRAMDQVGNDTQAPDALLYERPVLKG